MKYFLGIDGGSTKTHGILFDEDKKVIAEAKAGSANIYALEAEKVKKNFQQLFSELLKDRTKLEIEAAILGLASLDTEHDRGLFLDVLKPVLDEYQITNYSLHNDGYLALKSGSNKANAIILIAGTGSNCFGENDQGHFWKAGGLDFILSDEGSGYWLGLQALKSAVRSYDKRSPYSQLEELVCQHFNVEKVPQLKSQVYHPNLTKTEIAKLSRLCAQAAGQGDKVALNLVNKAIFYLDSMVATVATELGFIASDKVKKDFDLVITGGLSQNQFFGKKLEHTLLNKYSGIKILHPAQAPVFGAFNLV